MKFNGSWKLDKTYVLYYTLSNTDVKTSVGFVQDMAIRMNSLLNAL